MTRHESVDMGLTCRQPCPALPSQQVCPSFLHGKMKGSSLGLSIFSPSDLDKETLDYELIFYPPPGFKIPRVHEPVKVLIIVAPTLTVH